MKRTPLQRHTPLVAKSPLSRNTPLRSATPTPPGACSCGGGLPMDGDVVCRCGSSSEAWDGGAAKPLRRVRIRPVSKRRAKENRERRKMLAEIAEERPECAARLPMCTGWAQDGHEILTRARGGSITDNANVIGVCRPCHEELTNPADADQVHSLGLVRHSWDGPPGSAGAA